MRAMFAGLAALLIALPALAQTVEQPSGSATPAEEAEQEAEMKQMTDHAQFYHLVLVEGDYARAGGEDIFNWEGDAWIGGDYNKLWLKSEGEVEGGSTKQAEVQALYSRNIWTFFDAQIGARYDIEPHGHAYLAAGVQGLAPYLLETDIAAFLSDEGHVSVRFKQSFDLLITQRLILEPSVEADVYFQDIPEDEKGSGLSKLETGVQARYEFTRKFAPYVAAIYERRFGDTARLVRASGEDVGGWQIRTGVRFWF